MAAPRAELSLIELFPVGRKFQNWDPSRKRLPNYLWSWLIQGGRSHALLTAYRDGSLEWRGAGPQGDGVGVKRGELGDERARWGPLLWDGGAGGAQGWLEGLMEWCFLGEQSYALGFGAHNPPGRWFPSLLPFSLCHTLGSRYLSLKWDLTVALSALRWANWASRSIL